MSYEGWIFDEGMNDGWLDSGMLRILVRVLGVCSGAGLFVFGLHSFDFLFVFFFFSFFGLFCFNWRWIFSVYIVRGTQKKAGVYEVGVVFWCLHLLYGPWVS